MLEIQNKTKKELPLEKVGPIPWLLKCPITLLARVSFLKFLILLPFSCEKFQMCLRESSKFRKSWYCFGSPPMMSYLEDYAQLGFIHKRFRFCFDLWVCLQFICFMIVIRKLFSSLCIEVKTIGNKEKL